MTNAGEAATPRRWLVAQGEGRALLAAAGAYFLLLAGYYMLRSLREAFALEVGRDYIATLFYVTFVVMLGVLPLYWYVVARLPRRRLFPVIYSAVILLFAALALAIAAAPGERVYAAVYFVAVTSLNLFIVSVFWSVMVDAWRSESARRLFGFIAAGGSAGAIAGPAFNALFVERIGPSNTVLVACLLIFGAILLGRSAQRLEALTERNSDPDARLSLPVGGRAVDDLKRLVRSPYLLAIAALIVCGQLLGGFMYQEQAKYVEQAYTTLGERAALFARIDFAVSIASLAFQTLVVGWLATRGGLKVALGAVPLLLAGSLVLLALVPIGSVLIATQVFRRAVDYGLFKPTREMLFTVLNPESKFKSKSLIDTLLQRGGDSLSQALYPLVAGFGLVGVAWSLAGVSLGMMAVAVWLGARFGARDDGAEQAS
ncbi:MAG: MFS transporter [Gammaproteobacteria bacterium]|jgi:AAA family ATP:ADP antiporter|nr:MFS transporter [Gammaproteobacteria bacterium]